MDPTEKISTVLGAPALITKSDVLDIGAFLMMVRENVILLQLSPDQISVITADLQTAEVQLKSPQPKRAIVRETLKSIRNTILSASNKTLSHETAERTHDWIRLLG